MEPPDDVELLARMASRDQVALAALYDRHAGWLLLRLRRRCHDEGLVEEVLQDVFLSAWRAASSYAAVGPGGAGGWLWTLASRRLVDAQRVAARQARPLPDPTDSPAPGPEELLVTDLQHGDLGQALRRLPPDLRRVVQATVVDGLTVREAAVALGIPEGTVKTRAARARAQLRAGLT